jgi:diguanylate cyclase (GGDEF)-like protein
MSCAEVEATGAGVREQLRAWGNRTAKHYREKASQVRDLLMVMASAAESVGTRDLRCAGQLQEVTSQLREIASLDDLTQIRASIEKSAAVLKTSIDKLTSEGKTIVDELRKQVSGCRARLEQAEEIAARDALTGVRSRLNVESQIEIRMAAGSTFCVAMLDIDDFKQVNDAHGHITGDELLKQFAGELQSVCRSTDVVGRWGGDEFVILLDCTLVEAVGQRDRMHTWVCGNYTVQTSSGPVKLSLNVSIGVAEYAPGESLKELVARADDAMYEHKGISRSNACAR